MGKAHEDLNEVFIKCGQALDTKECPKCGGTMTKERTDKGIRWHCSRNWAGCFNTEMEGELADYEKLKKKFKMDRWVENLK